MNCASIVVVVVVEKYTDDNNKYDGFGKESGGMDEINVVFDKLFYKSERSKHMYIISGL